MPSTYILLLFFSLPQVHHNTPKGHQMALVLTILVVTAALVITMAVVYVECATGV